MLQFVYAGTGEIKMTGNSGSAATFYAPNALFSLSGNSGVFGSVLAHRIDNSGNADIHYDKRLQHDFYVIGHPIMGTYGRSPYFANQKSRHFHHLRHRMLVLCRIGAGPERGFECSPPRRDRE